MDALNRLPLGLLLGILLAFVLTTQMAQGQVAPPGPKVVQPGPKIQGPQLPGTPHHVTGSVEKGACPRSLNGAGLQVAEYWYTPTGPGDNLTLVVPFQRIPPSGLSLDPLSFTGRPLVQGRVLGGVNLTGDAASFDIQWLEATSPARVPWVQNVQNGRTGEIITVYRLLRLTGSASAGYAFGVALPVPQIMFFGAETVKNVGRIKIDCFLIGG